MQDALLEDGVTRVWERQVILLHRWSTELGILANAGVVMGSAHPDPAMPERIYYDHLVRFRDLVGESMWALVPGLGTQEGAVAETVRHSYRGPGSAAYNSSSGVTNKSPGEDCFLAARGAAEELRDDLNRAV